MRTTNSLKVAMNCPHCGTNVSPQATACPQCGHPIQRASDSIKQGIQREKTSESLAVLAFLAVCGAAWLIGHSITNLVGIAVLLAGSVLVWRWYSR